MKSATWNSIATASALALIVLFPNEPALAQGCPAPSFRAARSLDAPGVMAFGDFNGDSKPDLAVANRSEISVSLGQGDGTFLTGVIHKFSDRPRIVSVVVADFDRDGKADLAVANAGTFKSSNSPPTYNGDGGVSVFFGNGNGSFRTPATYGPVANPRSVAAGDFNGDGRPDLVVANHGLPQNHYSDGNVSVWLNKGDGTFGAASRFAAGLYPWFVDVADFNRDGKADLAVANEASRDVSVLIGNGDGTFQAAVHYETGLGPYAVTVADLNGDGKCDLAVANFGAVGAAYRIDLPGDVSVLIGKGDGTFHPSVNYSAGINPFSVVAGDLNGDGRTDLAAANNGSADVSILIGSGDGTFHSPINYAAARNPVFVGLTDFNDDQVIDLAVGGYNKVSILLGSRTSRTTTFDAAVNYEARTANYRAVRIGDFNGDGRLDLAALNHGWSDRSSGTVTNSGVSVLLGSGNGAFEPALISPTEKYPGSMAVGDFNHDGKPDVTVVSSSWTYLSVLLGNGEGIFVPAVRYPRRWITRTVVASDFNGDGNLDLATAESVLLGKGDGTFPTSVSHGAFGHPVAAGDFNDDGMSDLVMSGIYSSTNIWVLLGKSDGTFEAAVPYRTGAEPFSVAVGDFNSDGKLDLAVANHLICDWFVMASMSVLVGNGDGTFQPAIDYDVRPTGGVDSLLTDDFNGDGKLDLVVATDGVSVLLGNGDATFRRAVTFNAKRGTVSLAAGDFNGDSKPDLAVAAGDDRGLTVLLNTCVGPNATPLSDASATVTRVIARNNRDAPVVLDGSRSHDVDGDSLQFSWFLDGVAAASVTGSVAVVTLFIGSHDILLRVADGQTAGTNRITVVVITAAEAVDGLAADLRAAQLRHAQPLLSRLSVAARAFDRGNSDLGTHHLELFKKRLRELTERNEIDPATAAALLRDAQTIIAAMSDTQNPQPQFMVCKCEKGGHVRMLFTGAAARTYVIEASSDLKTWSPIGIGRERAEGEFEFEEAGTGLPACRFYRIVAP